MSTDQKRTPARGLWIGLTLFAILVIYPLSYGPFFALHGRGLSPHRLQFVYSPLEMFEDMSGPWVRETFRDYRNWWYRATEP